MVDYKTSTSCKTSMLIFRVILVICVLQIINFIMVTLTEAILILQKLYVDTYVTHLHKTSHKSPNIKWQKIAFYLKMSKKFYFLFLSKQHFFGKTLKIFVIFIVLLEFSCIFGYFESLFK